MTYYEELGVSENASPEEIGLAFECLSRQLAGVQIERLNGMAQVLLDPAGREQYDRALHEHSLMSLAAAVAGDPVTAVRESPDWRRLVAAAIAVATMLLVLIVGASIPPPAAPVHFPRTPQQPFQEDWEPLATYAYESHVPIPPLPFPEPQE